MYMLRFPTPLARVYCSNLLLTILDSVVSIFLQSFNIDLAFCSRTPSPAALYVYSRLVGILVSYERRRDESATRGVFPPAEQTRRSSYKQSNRTMHLVFRSSAGPWLLMQRSTRSGHENMHYEWWGEGRECREFGAHASDGQVPGSLFRNGRRCRCKLSNSQEEGGGRTGVAYFLLQ